MAKRSNSRKLAMRMLYQLSIRNTTISEVFENLEKNPYEKDTIHWAYTLTETVSTYLEDIDKIIEKYSIDWDMDRLNYIDKVLLRLGICEISYLDTPVQVVLNEMTELSKTYSTNESSKFINGILGKYANDKCSQE